MQYNQAMNTSMALKRIVSARNLTQQEAAKLFGVSRDSICNWLTSGIPIAGARQMLASGDEDIRLLAVQIIDDWLPQGWHLAECSGDW